MVTISALFSLEIKVSGRRASDTEGGVDLVGTAGLALAGIRLRIEGCSLEAQLALECSGVPELFSRALIAVSIGI